MGRDGVSEIGSSELRGLYLSEEQTGVPWLLDPDNTYVRAVLAGYEDRRPEAPCDALALAADLDDAVELIMERHIGIAEGEFRSPKMINDLLDWADRWKLRLLHEQPQTWGPAIGGDGYRLRRILGDSHCTIRGEDPERLKSLDPRRHLSRFHDVGPVVDVDRIGDVLCVRVRKLHGSPEEMAQLQAWADAHSDHFAYQRIVVDLRGNGGGSDEFVLEWIEDHVPSDVTLSDEGYAWQLGDHLLMSWNYGLQRSAMYDEPFALSPDPGARLTVVRDRVGLEAGRSPWHGRMLVITDSAVASAGESCAVFLRAGMGARVIGTRSAGLMLFGNIAPYVLPRSGLVLRLGTTRFGYPAVEFTGIPVDAELTDPAMTGAQVAERFDELWESAAPAAGPSL